MVKHNQTIRRQQLTNCLGVFDHFMWFALKELKEIMETLVKHPYNDIGLGIFGMCVQQGTPNKFLKK